MAFFHGTFETSIDGKHRMAIAAKFRDKVVPEVDGKSWILVLGANDRLWLYPSRVYEKISEMLPASPFPGPDEDTMSWYAWSDELTPDGQGRIVVPEASMERGRLQASIDVALVGNRDHVEIWPLADWKQHEETMRSSHGKRLQDAAERLRQQQVGGQKIGP